MKRYLAFVVGIAVLAGLFVISSDNYLLFHSVAELFSIVVAYGIFIIAWNCRRNLENHYLLLLGIAYFFVGSVDLLHTLAYKGMGVFSTGEFLQGEANLPTQLWIAARYLESISLFIAPHYMKRRVKISHALFSYSTVCILLLLSIFKWHIFPVCYIEGIGLTTFKKLSEIFISLFFFGSIIRLLQRRRDFEGFVLRFMIASLILSIASEIAFIFYVDVYGLSNLFGHFLKITSFYCIYRALIETGLVRPFDLLYRDLKKHEESLLKSEKQLRELNATKDRFFSIIAHDLRNPLISMLSIVQYLKDEREALEEGEKMRYLGDLDQVSNRTITLLDNLLQWAKCQTGDIQYDPAPWRLNDLLLEGTGSLEGYARNKGIHLEVRAKDDLKVLADRDMITTVVRNLVSNAVKFSHSGSEVVIDTETRNNMAVVQVKDRGVGISPQDREKLFRIDVPFSTLGTSRERGTGLGLILCRDFVRKHGGEIWLVSELDEGTIFHFTVPLIG